jgi:hypothetical protein
MSMLTARGFPPEVGAMDRVVVLTVDEVSVLIGLLDARWSRPGRESDASLADIATRYEQLLWSRAVEVDDEDTHADRPTLAARLAAARDEMRVLQRRNDDLHETVRALKAAAGDSERRR